MRRCVEIRGLQGFGLQVSCGIEQWSIQEERQSGSIGTKLDFDFLTLELGGTPVGARAVAQVVVWFVRGRSARVRVVRLRGGALLWGMRSASAVSALRMAELCGASKNGGIVVYDLAGAELNYPAKAHKQAFQLILDNNVNCTAHAGEAYGPESIAQAIHYCGCLLYTSPSPRDRTRYRMPSSA